MPTTRTAEPGAEPITLAEAKLHLRVDHADEDGLISGLISVARRTCEDRLERTLITTPWRLAATHFPPSGRLFLSMGPVQAVSSVQYLDTSGDLQTLAGADWQLAEGLLMPAFNKSWPSTLCQPGAVRVEYTAGYGDAGGDVPAPIRHWLKLAIGDLYANRERSSDKPSVPQHFADGLLDTYKVWGV